jgi:uncharacterized sulfatase
METHFPFWPPGEFVDLVAPYVRKSKEARNIIRQWNREAYRWNAPLEEPLGELEERVLGDMYDAEVAYQDNYLGPFFDILSNRANADNTLTIIASDHGDGLGEHDHMGHAFVAYQELLHVPLALHWPRRLTAGEVVSGTVSSRRIYHTVLDAAGTLPEDLENLDPAEVHGLTLMESVEGNDPEQNTAFAEIYPPLNLAKAIQHRQPELLDRFRCMEMRRALVKDDLKLIQVSGWAEELYKLNNDPLELANVMVDMPAEATYLTEVVEDMTSLAEDQRDNVTTSAGMNLEVDENLMQRLRGLGYIE